ncbi:hypothetical protein BKA70DRAFT_121714 [Coprinopsis sp. MPI-PUGE-AT-0042]|nr:hypothetical protein BKA70DRAFT_121714 [Coprinopsis sp. MPI-PUGE-AT-0042]
MSGVPTKMLREDDNLFTVLKKSSIHLTEIQSNGVCKPMLRYLLSYRDTLQRLILSVNRSDLDQLLAADLDAVLLQHQCSLRELCISAKLNSGWALGVKNKGLLLVSLPVLDTLSIPVFLDSGGSEEEEDYLRICLERAVNPTQFPRLRRLHIDCRFAEALQRLRTYRFAINDTHGSGLTRLNICQHEFHLPPMTEVVRPGMRSTLERYEY